jgi:hypothetical protein
VELDDLGSHDDDSSAFHDAQDVFLAHDEELLAVDLDFRTRVLPEQDLVARLDVQRDDLAVVGDAALCRPP